MYTHQRKIFPFKSFLKMNKTINWRTVSKEIWRQWYSKQISKHAMSFLAVEFLQVVRSFGLYKNCCGQFPAVCWGFLHFLRFVVVVACVCVCVFPCNFFSQGHVGTVHCRLLHTSCHSLRKRANFQTINIKGNCYPQQAKRPKFISRKTNDNSELTALGHVIFKARGISCDAAVIELES